MHTVAAGLAFGLGVALAALALLAGGGGAETLVVDGAGNGDFTTIGAAVANATAGDVIQVWNGSYQEQVVVDVAVMLLGNGTASTIIDANLSEAAPPVDGAVVNITAADVTLRGFTVTGGRHGVVLYRADDCVVGDNNLSGNYLDGFQDSGLYLLDTSGCTLTGNRVADNRVGVRIERSHDNLVADNNVSDNRNFGIKVADSRGNNLSQNRVNNNQYNIYLERCRDTMVVGNNASFHSVGNRRDWPSGGYAIYAYATSNSTFTGNNVDFGYFGLFLERSHNNTVNGNQGAGERMFMFTMLNSNDNFFNNNLVENTSVGFMLQNASNNSIVDNHINYFGMIGIWAWISKGNVITGNYIGNGPAGVFFEKSSSNTIMGNEFRKCYVAIALMKSKGNVVKDNVFIENEEYDIYRSWVDPPLWSSRDESSVEEIVTYIFMGGAVAVLAVIFALVLPAGCRYFLRRR